MARPIVRAATGILLSKRVILNRVAIPDVSATDWDNPVNIGLLETKETMDEEEESNGSAIADIPLYSRVVSMRLNLMISSADSHYIRWVLHKRPDGEATNITSSMIDANFHGADDTEDNREFRKYCLAKGLIKTSADRLQQPLRIFVRKQAWKRCSPMRENDTLHLTLAKESTGTTSEISGFGTIYVRANA